MKLRGGRTDPSTITRPNYEYAKLVTAVVISNLLNLLSQLEGMGDDTL